MSSTEVAAERAPRLFSGPHLPLVLGVVALVTLGAFENRAVGTALPTMVREFDALGSFGLANAAPNASYLVSLAVAGLWADRRGPIPALRAGAITFALAQLLVGTAPAIPMVVAGRLLSGLAEGLLDVALMVLVARALPAVLRPRMFSLFAAMWILPSVLGPLLTGVVTEHLGWRWVFLGAVALLIPSWLLLQPAMRLSTRTPAPERSTEDAAELAAWRAALPWAFGASVALFSMTLAGDQLQAHRVISGIVIPLSLAGRDHGLARVNVLRIGLALMTIGLAVTSLLAWTDATPWAGLIGWTMSIATALAVSGTLLALTADNPARWVFGAIVTTRAALAFAALLTAGRARPATTWD